MSADHLTHIDPTGEARMVDISAKPITQREARARARVRMSEAAIRAIVAGNLPKGDVFSTARIAGIQAAKRCSELIPMCHPLSLTFVDVSCVADESASAVRIESTVRCEARTGAEMEALTAAAVAALTIIDMAKSVDRWMTIEGLELVLKQGGKSGALTRPD